MKHCRCMLAKTLCVSILLTSRPELTYCQVDCASPEDCAQPQLVDEDSIPTDGRLWVDTYHKSALPWDSQSLCWNPTTTLFEQSNVSQPILHRIPQTAICGSGVYPGDCTACTAGEDDITETRRMANDETSTGMPTCFEKSLVECVGFTRSCHASEKIRYSREEDMVLVQRLTGPTFLQTSCQWTVVAESSEAFSSSDNEDFEHSKNGQGEAAVCEYMATHQVGPSNEKQFGEVVTGDPENVSSYLELCNDFNDEPTPTSAVNHLGGPNPLFLYPQRTGSSCVDAISLNINDPPVVGDTTDSKTDDGLKICHEVFNVRGLVRPTGLWYTFTGTGDTVRLRVEASFGPFLQLYTANRSEGSADLVCYTGGELMKRAREFALTFASDEGETYVALVHGTSFNGNKGKFTLELSQI